MRAVGEQLSTTSATNDPSPQDQPTPSGGDLWHQALLYSGEEEFRSEAGSFVRDGVAADEPVLVVVTPARADLLRSELGADSDRVYFVEPRLGLGRRPERFIPGWDTYLRRACNGRPQCRVWAVGEPGRLPASTAELINGQRYESLLDSAFTGDRPFRLLCPYDLDAVHPTVAEQAYRTHPLSVQRGVHRQIGAPPADGYAGHRLPEPESVLADCTFDVGQLGEVRDRVDGHAARLGLGGGRTYDYVLAVDEVASNSVMHGGGAGRLRIWRNGDCLTSEIHDQGLMRQTPEVDIRPSTDRGHGRGLWLVHQLCDLVQIRSAEDEGTTIRLHISRS